MYLCGYTATPEEKNTQQTTMGTHKHVSWEWHQHTSEVLDALKAGTDGKVHMPIYTLLTFFLPSFVFSLSFSFSFFPFLFVLFRFLFSFLYIFRFSFLTFSLKVTKKVIALETVKDQPNIYEFRFPSKMEGCVLLLGNERHGIEVDLLKRCDAIVRIPCYGVKNSLNVGVAFGICGYEVVRQWKFT